MFPADFLDTLQHGLRVEAVVVQLEWIEFRGHGDRLAVVAQGRSRGFADLPPGNAARSCADGDARSETLDIPLEGTRKGLVEIVEIEHQFPGGCAIPPEVAQVGVAAEFDPQVRSGTGSEIAGHDCGGPTQESERGATHSAVAQADEIREAGLVLLGQNGQRINAASVGRGLGMSLQGNGLPP